MSSATEGIERMAGGGHCATQQQTAGNAAENGGARDERGDATRLLAPAATRMGTPTVPIVADAARHGHVFISTDEHGLIRMLRSLREHEESTTTRPTYSGEVSQSAVVANRQRTKPKIRGSSAAWIVLVVELLLVHTLYLGLEAAASQVVTLLVAVTALAQGSAVGNGRSSIGDAGDTEIIIGVGLLLAAICMIRVGVRFLYASSANDLCRLRLPSIPAAAFAAVQCYLLSSAAASGKHELGLKRLFNPAIATPIAEEIYYRVVVLHLCANRIRSPRAAYAASAVVFAAGHMAEGWAVRWSRLVAGLALTLRFAGSRSNLAEVVLLHGMHNAAVIVTAVGLEGSADGIDPSSAPQDAPSSGGSLSQGIPEWVVFGGLAMLDAARLGLLPVCPCFLTSRSYRDKSQ